MAVARDDIRCPQCQSVRSVDTRQARRWRQGHITGVCSACRGRSSTRIAKDQHISYWLKLYGVQVPRGQKPRDVIAASGIPPDLARLAKDCWPDA